MAEPGTTFETPRACPFVALELDRDRRSDKPDYRHRCFAEPTPAPRSIAHQETYCLSPNFAACPVFQDWAVRAAARPASAAAASAASPSGPATVGEAAAGGAAMAAGAAASEVVDHDESVADVESEEVEAAPTEAAAPVEPVEAEPLLPPATAQLREDASVTTSGAEIAAAAAASTGMASPPTFATTGWADDGDEAHQLGAFDAPTPAIDEDARYDPQYDAHSSYGEPDAGYQEPPDTSVPVAASAAAAAAPAFVPPPSQPSAAYDTHEDAGAADAAEAAAVPAFLAGRSTRPTTAAAPATEYAANVPPARQAATDREQLVPSWDIDSRYGAEPPPVSNSGGGGGLDGILTAVAVIAILALGVAAVLFLPGLLNGKKPAATFGGSFPAASFATSPAPSVGASLLPSLTPTVGPSVAPTVAPSVGPVASPRTYKIKAGDSLAKIANKFGISVQDILDANPNITNPNNIIVGQIIVIPAVAPSPAAT